MISFQMVCSFLSTISPVNLDATVEASLAQVAAVQARLADNQRQLQEEIDSLKAQLKEDQDPNRMQLIQEMISVLVLGIVMHSRTYACPGPSRTDVADPGESHRVGSCCKKYHQRYTGS